MIFSLEISGNLGIIQPAFDCPDSKIELPTVTKSTIETAEVSDICSKLTIKTPNRRQSLWCLYCCFEQIANTTGDSIVFISELYL